MAVGFFFPPRLTPVRLNLTNLVGDIRTIESYPFASAFLFIMASSLKRCFTVRFSVDTRSPNSFRSIVTSSPTKGATTLTL